MGKMNEQRAAWAEEAIVSVKAFAERLTSEEGGPYEAVKDLICDLMHYCDREKVDFGGALAGAELYHEGEVTDDE